MTTQTENPYKNLEGVERIGIEAWRGIVIRLMDKFERVEQYCTNGELAIKSEGMEDTFKDIAVYSTLAMILFRKQQDEALKHSTQRKPSTKVFDKTQEWVELERGKGAGRSKLSDEEIALQDRDNRTGLITSALPQFAYEHDANSHKYERTGKK